MPDKNRNNPPILTEPQTKALAALLTSRSFRQAALKCGIDRETIAGWLRNNETFRSEYKRASSRAFEEALAELRGATGESVRLMRSLIRGKDKKLALEAARELLTGSFDADLVLRAKDAESGNKARIPEDD